MTRRIVLAFIGLGLWAFAARADLLPPPDIGSAIAPHWTTLLNAHVSSKDGKVDYVGLEKDADALQKFLALHDTMDPSKWDDAQKKATYINLYNAGMMANLLRYAKEHPQEKVSGSEFLKVEVNKIKVPKGNIWNGDYTIRLGGKTLTLDDIEHGLIRNQDPKKWGDWAVKDLDPRIHAAVNCAALSCPRVRETAYTSENLNKMLNENIREFVNSPAQFSKVSDTKLKTNSIVLWYYDDFDDYAKKIKMAGAGDYLAQFVDDARPDAAWIKKHLKEHFNDRWPLSLRMSSNFDFFYNWRVNDQRN